MRTKQLQKKGHQTSEEVLSFSLGGLWIRLSNGWMVGSDSEFSIGTGSYGAGSERWERPDKAYPILHVTEPIGRDPQSPFCVNYWWLTERRLGRFTSPHMISIHDRICIEGSADEDFTRIGQVQQMGRHLTMTNSLILRLSASWPSCIFKDKQWMWSCWKLVSVGFWITTMW